jgi:serine protease Do
MEAITLTMSMVPYLLLMVLAGPAAQPHDTDGLGPLRQLSGSVEALVRRVSPSVVQVIVTAYTTVDRGDSGQVDLVLGKQRSVGSGVVIDEDGYIITNAHVIKGARRVQVIAADSRGRPVDAAIIGVADEIDLALLKVEVKGLRPLPIANEDHIRQGEMVFAFGSPQGLRDSVTMGLISATSRQPDPDAPMTYIQTDAPINRGNSGGPLVNTDGELVGINTFILSNSGGSEGLGFAIPSALVSMAYPKLRQYGHLHRGQTGMLLQTITPELAEGLGLHREYGVIVSDVIAGGPADAAGVQIGDVIDSVDGHPVQGILPVAMRLFTSNGDERLTLRLIRGKETVRADVAVVAGRREVDRISDLLDPEASLIAPLGVLGIAITDQIAPLLPSLRAQSGVIIAARAPENDSDVPLLTGDVIHAVNGVPVVTLESLRALLAAVRPRGAIVLQLERRGQLMYVAFNAD